MKDLSDLQAIKKLDPQDTLGTTEKMVEQLKVAWDEVQTLDLPEISNVENIVFCGMGASIYGALVVKSLLGAEFPYPSEVVTDYHLPEYVNKNTLVVLTSYSGTTEEVLSCAKEAKEKSAKMIVLTHGGTLAQFAKENNIPSYVFDGRLNPASVPRLGCGYSILGLIGLLTKTKVLKLDTISLSSAVQRTEQNVDRLQSNAIELSEKLVGKIPIVFAAEHLSGNAQILRNQFNETSKAFSAYYLVPDLNHHLMEGLKFPTNSNLYFLLFQSKNYTPKIHKRMELTKDVVNQNKQTPHWITFDGETIYDDFLSMLIFGSFLTLYLGLRYDQNPAINPWVDYFKDKLKTPA